MGGGGGVIPNTLDTSMRLTAQLDFGRRRLAVGVERVVRCVAGEVGEARGEGLGGGG